MLREPAAPATARASAARTLVEFFGEDEEPSTAGGGELSVDELDAEIERLKREKPA